MPTVPSSVVAVRRWSWPPITSSPPSVVRSERFSGTRQQACGRVRSATATISSVAAISKFSGTVSSALSRAMSSSRMWRRSSRRCAVMPSAPASTAKMGGAHRIGHGAAARVAHGGDMVDVDAEAQPAHPFTRSTLLTIGRALQLRDDRAEMLEVADLDVGHQQPRSRARAASSRCCPMLAPFSPMTVAMIAQRAGLVNGGDRQLGGKERPLVLADLPAHVEPAFGLVVEARQLGRLDRVDGDRAVGIEDADDAVAGQRSALGRRAWTGRSGCRPASAIIFQSTSSLAPGTWNSRLAMGARAEPAGIAGSLRRRRPALLYRPPDAPP